MCVNVCANVCVSVSVQMFTQMFTQTWAVGGGVVVWARCTDTAHGARCSGCTQTHADVFPQMRAHNAWAAAGRACARLSRGRARAGAGRASERRGRPATSDVENLWLPHSLLLANTSVRDCRDGIGVRDRAGKIAIGCAKMIA